MVHKQFKSLNNKGKIDVFVKTIVSVFSPYFILVCSIASDKPLHLPSLLLANPLEFQINFTFI
ncbi:hypothetical protein M23134_00684 [Microscilla marina ATCC 23134]|uniref:Uncharacterized protein n=1 Tax=Microscilla marina ATCC 23134 TaxID=313606 RepID=A1ZVP3_MICM2|nr:hypothetical protein M23134_00684 [Microscilla marina ATCC 23134]